MTSGVGEVSLSVTWLMWKIRRCRHGLRSALAFFASAAFFPCRTMALASFSVVSPSYLAAVLSQTHDSPTRAPLPRVLEPTQLIRQQRPGFRTRGRSCRRVGPRRTHGVHRCEGLRLQRPRRPSSGGLGPARPCSAGLWPMGLPQRISIERWTRSTKLRLRAWTPS